MVTPCERASESYCLSNTAGDESQSVIEKTCVCRKTDDENVVRADMAHTASHARRANCKAQKRTAIPLMTCRPRSKPVLLNCQH